MCGGTHCPSRGLIGRESLNMLSWAIHHGHSRRSAGQAAVATPPRE
ncbi:hypothetical protein [Lysobacter gummosus]